MKTARQTRILLHALLACLLIGLSACANPNTPAQLAAANAVSADFTERRMEMLRRFPPANPGTVAQREAAAREIVDAHRVRRAELGRPYAGTSEEGSDRRYLGDYPPINADFVNREERNAARRHRNGGPGRARGHQRDVARIAAARLEAERPGLRGPERRTALLDQETVVRAAIVEHRRTRAGQAAEQREVELARLAGTNLADMPREILRAAEENLADTRSPFDAQRGWRPSPDALRQEEVRLRNAVSARVERAARDERERAMAEQREAIARQCRYQSQIAASAVLPAYGRGVGGAIAAGVVTEFQRASVETQTFQACLRGSGL